MVHRTPLLFILFKVSDVQYDEDTLSNIPQVSYEFPNGYSNDYGVERFKIPESLFDPSIVKSPQAAGMLSAAHVVTTSVGKLNHVTYKLNCL